MQTPVYIDETPDAAPQLAGALIGSSLKVQTTAEALKASNGLVIKSHLPGPFMLRLARVTNSPIILSVRDPRDAVCSMMMRFRASFKPSLRFVEPSANALAKVRDPALLLRYEDEFFGSSETVKTIAVLLGIPCDETIVRAITEDLSPGSVARQLKELTANGVFDPRRSAGSQFDPLTHWHPNHVGDLSGGKWRSRLSVAENAEIMRAVADFMDSFGYVDEQSAVHAGETVRFCTGHASVGWLKAGFSGSEEWGTWTCESKAVVRFQLAAPAPVWLSLQLVCKIGPSLRFGEGAGVAISVNGRHLYQTSSAHDATDLCVPLFIERPEVKSHGRVEIIFIFSGLRAASDLLDTTDSRMLGLGLVAASVDFG